MLELNKIYNMDCIEGFKLLDSNSINLIQADPPYNFDAGGGGLVKRKGYLKNITESFGHSFNPGPYLKASLRLMETYNSYWWCNKNLLPDYLNFAVDNGFNFNVLTWHKLNCMPLHNNTYLPDTEYCVFIRESKGYFNSHLKNMDKYKRYYHTIAGHNEIKEHPTPKPLWIIKGQIEISSRPGDIILDPFIGIGTSGIACKQLKRKFIGFDTNKEYIKFANKQIKNTVPDKKPGSQSENKKFPIYYSDNRILTQLNTKTHQVLFFRKGEKVFQTSKSKGNTIIKFMKKVMPNRIQSKL